MDGWTTGEGGSTVVGGESIGIWRKKWWRSRGEPRMFDVRWLALLLSRWWLVAFLCYRRACDAIRECWRWVTRSRECRRRGLAWCGDDIGGWCCVFFFFDGRVFFFSLVGFLLGCWLAALLLVNSQLF